MANSNTSREFKRGELRVLSAALIEANADKTISEVAALHVRDFGFHEFKVAVIHIRWMLRENLVANAEALAERWSRKNEKVTLVVAPSVEDEVEAPVKAKRVRPSRSKKKAVEAEVETTDEVVEAVADEAVQPEAEVADAA